MSVSRSIIDRQAFNPDAQLPFNLRQADFELAMQDVYDFFFDVNSHLVARGLQRLDDMLRAAILSGVISDMLTASVAKHSRSLTQNRYHNGHPDLIVAGAYADDAVKAGERGAEIKATRKAGGSVDMHGAREQWLCVFVYEVDHDTSPASNRRALMFREVYLAHVRPDDFRHNARGELGTRTASLDRNGIAKLRENWVYRSSR